MKLDLEKGWHHFSELIDKHPSKAIPRVDIVPEGAAQDDGGKNPP